MKKLDQNKITEELVEKGFIEDFKYYTNKDLAKMYNVKIGWIVIAQKTLGFKTKDKIKFKSWNSGLTSKDDPRILSGDNHPMHIKGGHTLGSRAKISKNHADVSGENNPMHGVHRYGESAPTWHYEWPQQSRDKLSLERINHPVVNWGIKYYYNNIYFDSSWELYYYIFLTDNSIDFKYHDTNYYFEYTDMDSIKHKYFPDFIVGDKIIEIKSDYLLNNMLISGTNENCKYKCMLRNNVIIYTKDDLLEVFNYINNKYGKNYIKTFKVK